MALALATIALRRTLRDKELNVSATPSGNYTAATSTNIATGAFTQSAAGQPLKYTFTYLATLGGSVTFSTSGGTGAGTQAVNLATYTGLTSTNQTTAQAAANALAAALTAGALGAASGSVYSAVVSYSATNQGILAIYTNKAAEVLSVTVSTGTSLTIGGDTLNLTAITAALGQSDATIGYPGTITQYEVTKLNAGYPAIIIPGPTLATWLLKLYSAPGTELATGAYSAALLADVFNLRFIGPKLRM